MSDADSLIEATSGPSRTMADDTFRLQLNVPAGQAQSAFSLFRARGTHMALAVPGSDEDVIEAATATIQTMAKGELRLFVDIEPRHAGAAFERFGAPGTSLFLAAIKPEHLRQRAAEVEQRQRQRMEVRGGSRAALAAQWCNEGAFVLWLAGAYPTAFRQAQEAIPDGRGCDWAAHAVRECCGIKSRAELDSDPAAWALFNQCIRQPYMASKEQPR